MLAVVSFWYQTGGGASALAGLLPFILIFVIFYFLLFLPSQRRQKQHQQMLSSLKHGDRVVTSGGIRGTIVALKDDCVHLRIPPNDIRLEIARNAIAERLSEEQKKSA